MLILAKYPVLFSKEFGLLGIFLTNLDMVFGSNIFLFAFLPLTLLLYFLFPQKHYKNTLLLIASVVFYAWGELYYVLLLFLSIIGNYFFGIALEKSKFFSGFYAKRKFVLAGAIAFNLLILGYFKYSNFLIEVLNSFFGFEIETIKVRLPIGISFFTFHAISYIIDIHRKKCQAQKNLFQLALYISFFPQLVAGPIVRYNFIEKYLSERRHSFFFIAYGIRRFVIGLGKKVIIANPLGEVADIVFNSPAGELSCILAWVGIVCYTLQIYFDFSGYSDMAVGLARVFGFKFPENFNYPYISRSIKEFWRRWHISLSSWFRDYVYIPLGGNRVSFLRQYFNLILVFFLCGMWHGASWNFIVWGMFHGLFLVIERLFPQVSVPKALCNFYTIFVVMIGWVFFRSPDLGYSFIYLKTMFFGSEIGFISNKILLLMRSHFIWTIFILALLGISPFVKRMALKLMRKSKVFITIFDLFLIAVFILAAIRLSAATHNPFIYFQF